MNNSSGQTLIELVMFIVIVGIALTASVTVFSTVLRYSERPGKILTASQLANARMNIILQQRRLNGFSGLTDPCSSGSLAACTTLNTFATNNGYVISSSISDIVSGARTATVTVTGAGSAMNVMRFVQ